LEGIDAEKLTSALLEAAQTIFERSLTPDLLPVRLLGVGAVRLSGETVRQGNLFDGESRARQQLLDRTVNAISGQFGAAAVRKGSSLDRSGRDDA
jgi:hypothetical protein